MLYFILFIFPAQNRRPVVYLPTKEDGATEQRKIEERDIKVLGIGIRERSLGGGVGVEERLPFVRKNRLFQWENKWNG